MPGELQIRPLDPGAADAWVALLRDLEPAIVQTPAGLLHTLATAPERARTRTWTAWAGGELRGIAVGRMAWWTERDDLAYVWAGVHPNARRQGLGTRLLGLAEEHVRAHGARKVETWTSGDPDGERFAAGRGFTPSRTTQNWSVDPRAVDVSDLPRLEREHAAAGRRLVALQEVVDRERELHALYAEATADEPSDEEEVVRFDEWRETMLGSPTLSLDGSAIVLDGELPVSLAWLGFDAEGGRASHWFTGTLRSHRRRGLARLAKLFTIRWAAENAITALYTGNDSTNADMLALNEHLGYRPRSRGQLHAKQL